ncbi:MAG: Glucose 1-dehydrogenase 4 [Acidimicrobiales bacterium]|nr:MAG: SDR family oxidoreductase [Actinomycetota bacterium]MBV6508181.1 Glucose 1-dehydrogenase 4 [Acidimicrobiales bacterium]RIK08164.1 MAG: short chain dehydrogenase [Acidobacteriota bacterium]
MDDPFELSGKAVVITGGTKGIGRTIADTFMEHGAEVVVCGRNEPTEPIAVGGRQAVFVAADVRDPEQVDALVGTAVERLGGVDVLINNAGGSPEAETATVSPKFNEAIIRLNLIAPLQVAQRCNLVMQSQPDGGSIINVGSVSGIRPSPGTAAYGAAKAGLLNLTETLAVEWAPKVRVNAVVAGLIETEQADLHYGDESGVAAVAGTIPLGRMGTPADVAAACLFLASPLASYMSGGRLLLHGGGEVPAYLGATSKRGSR